MINAVGTGDIVMTIGHFYSVVINSIRHILRVSNGVEYIAATGIAPMDFHNGPLLGWKSHLRSFTRIVLSASASSRRQIIVVPGHLVVQDLRRQTDGHPRGRL